MAKLYFAYGSNLSLEQMKVRCPKHKFIGEGILNGYRWIISSRGYANIIESEPDAIHGVVYEITVPDEQSLDRHEGVNSNSYQKEMMMVEVDGQNKNCLVYIDPIKQEGEPKPEYIVRINKGIVDSKLPPEYVERYIRKFIPA